MILKNHGELFQRCEVNPTLTFEDVPYQAHSVEEDNIILKGPGELFQRYKKNPILTAEDWPYQAHSVFNPAAAIVNGITLLIDIIGHIAKKNILFYRSKLFCKVEVIRLILDIKELIL
jgi:hypothetical protein